MPEPEAVPVVTAEEPQTALPPSGHTSGRVGADECAPSAPCERKLAGTRCRDCGLRWQSPAQAHCAACHRQFGSSAAFGRHQRTDDEGCPWCSDPSEMLTKRGDPVFKLRDDGCWVGWMSREAQARLAETWGSDRG